MLAKIKFILSVLLISCSFLPITMQAQSKTSPVDKFRQLDELLPTPNEQRTASGAPGHSYWMVDDADAVTAERIWSYQVRPYLAEHWFEQPEQLAQLDQDVRALIAEQS